MQYQHFVEIIVYLYYILLFIDENINTVKCLNGEEVIHQLVKSGNRTYKKESRKALEIISGKKSCCILM